MKAVTNAWLPILALALALGGCVAVQPRPASVFPGVLIMTASADPSAERAPAERAPEIRGAEPAHEVRNAEP